MAQRLESGDCRCGWRSSYTGKVASITDIPVIGFPVKSSISNNLWGSILSILRISVATGALDASENAHLAAPMATYCNIRVA